MDQVMTPEHPRWLEFADNLAAFHEMFGCDHKHTSAEYILERMGGIDIEKSIEFFQTHGGYCDCEVGMNVIWNEEIRREGEEVMDMIGTAQYKLIAERYGEEAAERANYGWSVTDAEIATKVYVHPTMLLITTGLKSPDNLKHEWSPCHNSRSTYLTN